ncbi:MAG TPA: ABC transporter substrate-binding protein [Clostridia bacterium]|nr:ABC transporter substrate-binding protein [Clostridia bacterium]
MKKYLLPVSLIFLTLLFLFGGYRIYQDRTKEITTLNIAEFECSLLHIPMYIALKENFFGDYNIRVKYKTTSPDDFYLAKGAGQADVVIGETVQCLFTKPSDIRNNWLCFTGITNSSGYFLLAHDSMPGFKWEDIKGKTVIAGPPENSGELILEGIVREKGLRPLHDFNILWNIPENLKIGAFKAGTASYILVKEPLATIVKNEKQGTIVSALGVEAGEIPEVVLVARKNFAKENRTVIQGVTNSIYKAQIWMGYHNSREIAHKVKDYFPKVNKKVLEEAIERHLEQATWALTPLVQENSYEKLQEITRLGGELYGTVPFEDEVDTQYAKQSTSTVEYIPEDKREKKYPQDFLRILSK